MNLKRLAATAALALTSLGSFAVALPPLDLTSGSTGFMNTPIAGAFVDTATFTLTSTSLFTGSVTSVVSGTQNVDFSSIVVTGPSGTFGFTKALGDPFELWTTGPGNGFTLSAGAYTLTLTGTNSASIGSYAGNVGITPVPEPETLALMLAGLGVVGFVAGRRRG